MNAAVSRRHGRMRQTYRHAIHIFVAGKGDYDDIADGLPQNAP